MPAARARLTVDLDALAANHAVLKQLAGPAEVAPVLKADGYGLGAGPIGRRLWAEGARSFFVARLEEGEALRAGLGPDRPARGPGLGGAAGGWGGGAGGFGRAPGGRGADAGLEQPGPGRGLERLRARQGPPALRHPYRHRHA